MFILSPHIDPDDPFYQSACEMTLSADFDAIIQAHPARKWEGDEAEFWPLRRAARKAGWTIEAIDKAVSALVQGGNAEAAPHKIH